MDAGLSDAGVSVREAEVLDLLGDALSHAEIAQRLFLSVRTVESHAASLRRKLGLPDHRSLVQLAVSRRRTTPAGTALPVPLTSFIGRSREVADLLGLVRGSRLVTAVGPGGVGKTRLALAVTERLAEQYGTDRWFADLAPLTDPALVPAAVRVAVGVGEVTGSTAEQSLVAAIGRRHCLLVLDNCEHVLDAAALLAEQLLAHCPGLRVLATSRVRTVVPYETVYVVPGLDVSGDGDALALFRARALSAGAVEADDPRGHEVCAALDGSALAIELAAARLPSLGWDALTAGLSDQIGLLTGGARRQPRQRSLEATLDWSYRLLDEQEQAVLRRVTVFAAPFTADAAQRVAAFGDVSAGDVLPALARLTEHSLLTQVGAGRWRALETIRQYGRRQPEPYGQDESATRHFLWCLDVARHLEDTDPTQPRWQHDLDAAVADLRAALGWASSRADQHAGAYQLSLALAQLLFLRGRPSEAQRRYEEAALLTTEPALQADALRLAAAVARCRVDGPAALALHRRLGDLTASTLPAVAGTAYARGAELISRFAGMFVEPPDDPTFEWLLGRAAELGGSDRAVEAAVLAARANRSDPEAPDAGVLHDDAVAAARAAGLPLLESSALDASVLARLVAGDVTGAAALARRRLDLVAHLPFDPEVALELKDALHVAMFTHLGSGDLPAAAAFGERHAGLPFLREEYHLAVDEVLAPYALAGDWTALDDAAARFEDSWRAAGRPPARGRALGPAAVVLAKGLRGDAEGQAHWRAVLADILGTDVATAGTGTGYGEVFTAMLALHEDRPADALVALDLPPARLYGPLLRQWAAALRAEAAVLTEDHDAGGLLTEASAICTGNPVATGIVARARAVRSGDVGALLTTADALDAVGAPYQADRCRRLAR